VTAWIQGASNTIHDPYHTKLQTKTFLED
jgi:hypothetical protein